MVMSERAKHVVALRKFTRELVEELYEARKYIAKAISKIDDVERAIKEKGGWGYNGI